MARFTDQYGNGIDYQKAKTECLIDGNILNYDACGRGDLDFVKEYYKDFKYIGSSKIYYLNGVVNNSGEFYHFFVKK